MASTSNPVSFQSYKTAPNSGSYRALIIRINPAQFMLIRFLETTVIYEESVVSGDLVK